MLYKRVNYINIKMYKYNVIFIQIYYYNYIKLLLYITYNIYNVIFI